MVSMCESECEALRGETSEAPQPPKRSVARAAAVAAAILGAAALATAGAYQWSSVRSQDVSKTPVSLQDTVGYVEDLINTANEQVQASVVGIRDAESKSDWVTVAQTAHRIDRLKEHLVIYTEWNDKVLQAMKHLDDGEYEKSDEMLKTIRTIKCKADQEGIILQLENQLADFAVKQDFEQVDKEIQEIEAKEEKCE